MRTKWALRALSFLVIFTLFEAGIQLSLISKDPARADLPFGTNRQVDDAPPGNAQERPVLVRTGPLLFAAWNDVRNGDWDVYFANSTDGGVTWGTSVRVVDDTTNVSQLDPTLFFDGLATLHLAWTDFRDGIRGVYYAQSTNGGGSWSLNRAVNETSGGEAYDASIASGMLGLVCVAWTDTRNGPADVYFANSTDGGTTWGTNVKVNNDSTAFPQEDPSLAVSPSGILHVAWEDRRSGTNYDIYYANSTNGGANWTGNVKINDDFALNSQRDPSLAVDASTGTYVIWQDDRNVVTDIYAVNSTDGGLTWGTNVRVTADFPNSPQQAPSLAADAAGTLFAAWQDQRIPLEYEIYFAKSTDGGATWSFPNIRVNDDSPGYNQFLPSVAADALGSVSVAWEDYRNTPTGDIYMANLGPPAPYEINAFLEAGFANVNITWTLPVPETEVDHYEVWRGGSYSTAQVGYAKVSPVLPTGTSFWVDVGAGAVPFGYFYAVHAVAAGGANSSSAGQAAKLFAPLSSAQPYLLSTSVVNSSQQPQDNFRGTLGWSLLRQFNASDSPDHWKSHDVSKTINDLPSVDRTHGVWVRVSSPGEFRVAGKVPCRTTIALRSGWNAVGYAGMNPQTVASATAGLVGPILVEGMAPLAGPYYLQILSPASMMTPLQGYWIHSMIDQSWTVVNDPGSACQ